MILLHGFIKKSQTNSGDDLALAKTRLRNRQIDAMKKAHIGSNFDDFLDKERTASRNARPVRIAAS